MDKFKIKEEYKYMEGGGNIPKDTIFESDKTEGQYFCVINKRKYWADVDVVENSGLFEKVEERIELHQDRYSYGSEKRYGLSKKDFSDYTGRERDLCEGILNVDPELAKKFLNGDLVENDKPIEKQCFNLNNYNYRHENGMLSVEPIETIPNKSEVPDGLGGNVLVGGGFKEEGEIVTLTDTGTIRNSWDEKTKHPVEGDELITTDLEKQTERISGWDSKNIFTKDQMIQMHDRWTVINQGLKKVQDAGIRQTEPLPTFEKYVKNLK